jgi:hypothetical protein
VQVFRVFWGFVLLGLFFKLFPNLKVVRILKLFKLEFCSHFEIWSNYNFVQI